jgi:AcrR family transcriptional regulator
MKRRLTRDEKRAQTRAALLDAGIRVFVRDGFAGASVEEISAEAGYSRGAFYWNFRSKEELFVELLQTRVIAPYREIVAQRSEAGERRPLGEIGAALAAVEGDPEQAWAWRLWLELLSLAAREPDFRQLAAGVWDGTRQLIAEVVQSEYERSDSEPPADPRALASALMALGTGLALQHLIDPDAVPLSLYPELYQLLFEPITRP